jgi:pimeloyl-ACP methyl ester carboxylesterase
VVRRLAVATGDPRGRQGTGRERAVVRFRRPRRLQRGIARAPQGHCLGLGQLADHPALELGRENRWQWSLDPNGTRIDRVVLIAGVNRGWSLEERPTDMPIWHYLVYRSMLRVVRVLPVGGFIQALERGEPFVADLRLQWLRAGGLGWLPPTIQLLGTVDDIVGHEDNKDVLALENAKVLLVDGADHKRIMHLHEAPIRGRLVEALVGARLAPADEVATARDEDEVETARERAWSEYGVRAESNVPNATSAPSHDMVVLPIHGIRANADWCKRFRELLFEKAAGRTIYCPCASYGHLSMLRFLLTGRRRKVRWFVDQYTEAVAAVGAKKVPVHFVGHSNGTYLLARALLDYRTITFDRVALGGSVVQRHFPWARLHKEGRLRELRNERAAKDWIVGCFPGFYQQLGALLPGSRSFFDIGNGGLYGFDNPPADQDVERFYLDGGHGAAMEAKNLPHLVDYILERPEQQRQMLDKIPTSIWLFSNMAWLVWLVIGLIVVAIGYCLSIAVHPLAIVPYLLVLYLVLRTV